MLLSSSFKFKDFKVKYAVKIAFSVVLMLTACKKDKKISSEQYYGEAIEATKEYFSMQELFSFTSSPAVSPDGNYLAYEIASTISIEKHGIWILNLNTGEKYMFKKHANSPDWAPSGTKLCYSLNGIYIDNITGTEQRLIQSEGGFEPKWHPKGDTISYVHPTKGLNFINLLTNETIRVNDYTGGGHHSWNLDGITILGWKSAAPIGYFTTWNKISKKLTEINPKPKSYNTNPVYSYDGTKIAFQADNAIYIIKADGTELQQLLYNKVNRRSGEPYKKGDKLVNNLCWHPDGKHIIYQQIEFVESKIASWGAIMGEGYSTLYKLSIETALQTNKY